MQSETWLPWGERGVMTGEGEKSRILFTVEGEHLADEQRYRDTIIADHTAASTLRDEKPWRLGYEPFTHLGHLTKAGFEKVQEVSTLRTALTEALQLCDDVDWLMDVVSGLEGLARVHGYEADVDAILRGVEIRARVKELRAALHTPTGAGTAEAN